MNITSLLSLAWRSSRPLRLAAWLFLGTTLTTASAATIVVNSTADPSGYNGSITIAQLGATVTLRDAVNACVNTGGANTITFAASLAGQTINLLQVSGGTSALNVGNSGSGLAIQLTIQGLTGSQGITISRGASSGQLFRLFTVVSSQGGEYLTFNDLTLANGYVSGQVNGGAIINVGDTVNLNRCTLSGNSAYAGAAIYNQTGYINLTSCTIANNSASNSGGGLYDYQGQSTLTNCTVTGNSAQQGGGLFTQGAQPILVNTIVAGDSASINIPEIFGQVASSSHNNLCSDPGVTVGAQNGAGGMVNGQNNNIIGRNARLSALASNGGPTQTAALLGDSPAIGTGSTVSGVTTDQRGVAFYGTPDIGAYEAPSGPPSFTSVTTTTFASATSNTFLFTANGNPPPTFSETGSLPSNVTLSSNGTLSGTPPAGSEGNYPIVVTAHNIIGPDATQNFTLKVVSTGLVVTTATDEDNGNANPSNGTGTSLREALNYAASLTGAQTIYISPTLAGQTLALTITGDSTIGSSAFKISTQITIQGVTGNQGVTISGGGSLRPFYVAFSGNLTVNDLTIANGSPGGNYGGAIANVGTLTVNRCTLTSNSASLGGAVYSAGINSGSPAYATLVNCTIYSNSATYGGGIYNDSSSSLTLTADTIAQNTFNQNGGGLDNVGTATTTDTIFAYNYNSNFSLSDIAGSVTTSTSKNNLFYSTSSGGLSNGVNGNQVNVDPLLGNLANNGGPTETLAITSQSSAFNAGLSVSGVTTDQRSSARHSPPDIGAFEISSRIAATPTFTPAAGSYTGGVTVILSGDSGGTVIHYTLDGSTPSSTSGTVYSNPFSLPVGTTTVKAIATGASLQDSPVASATYTVTAVAPTVSTNAVTNLGATSATLAGNVTVSGGANVTARGFVYSSTNQTPAIGGSGVTMLADAGSGTGTFSDSTGSVLTAGVTYYYSAYATSQAGTGYGSIVSFKTIIPPTASNQSRSVPFNTATTITLTATDTNSPAQALSYVVTTSPAHGTLSGKAPNLTYTPTSNYLGGDRLTFTAGNSGTTNSTATVYLSVGPGYPTLNPVSQTVPEGATVSFSALAEGLIGGTAPDSLSNGAALLPGQSILSDNHGYRLTYQSNGDLVLYRGDGTQLWDTGTAGQTAGMAVMQGDGNLVVYDASGTARYATNTNGNPGASVLMQNDGNLVIYRSSGGSVFATNTSYPGPDDPTPGLAWQVSTDGGMTFHYANSNAQTLTFATTLSQNSYQYRAAFTDAGATYYTTVATLTVLTPLQAYRVLQGLAANGSQDLADPAGDGVANLLKYAFNMAPNAGGLTKPNITVLPVNGSAGLPYISIDAQDRLVIEFVRRQTATDPGITYTVETGSNLTSLTTLDLSNATVVNIDGTFERVTVTDPTVTPNRFGRVRVSINQ